MSKKLITVDNLEEYICRASAKFYMDSTVILTPGARDELKKRGIAIVPGPAPEAAPCHPMMCESMTREVPAYGTMLGLTTFADMEELLVGVAAILKNEYGITDPAELRDASLQAVKTIKDNLAPKAESTSKGNLHIKIC